MAGKGNAELGHCISAVLGSVLRNPDSSQYHDFKGPLNSVGTLVDFSLIVQYHSHTSHTLVYMERYLQTFHWTKDIVLVFRILKTTLAEGNCQDRDPRELMANQCANEACHYTAAKRRRQVDPERLKRPHQ